MRSRIGKTILSIGLLLAAACAAALLINASSGRMKVLDSEQIAAVLENNDYADDRSRIIAESAVSLVGRVNYFWGGKSYCVGPDPAWGEPRQVTSEGSPKTGAIMPYGLDCSGYVTWVFLQLEEEGMLQRIGEGTWAQWQNSEPIDMSQLRVGDLVFQNPFPGSSANHVAVCVGFYKKEPVFAHCSSAENNVVVTTAGSVFRYARRPKI